MARKEFVVIGQALKPFGVKGEIRIRPFTESFYAFEQSSSLVFNESRYTVANMRRHKGTILVTLEGIDAPEDAARLTGSLVSTRVENLPPKEEDEYYWFELLGMKVLTVDALDLGEIVQIIATGANDVLSVMGPYGEVLLPMVDEVVVEVDIENGTMIVDPLDGMIPDA